MSKLAMIFTWIVVLLCLVSGVFFVKYEVISLEEELATIEKDIDRTGVETHILRAEWSFLNNPNRLRVLADKYLKNMNAVTASQVTSMQNCFGGEEGENKEQLKMLAGFKETE